ncbi:MAG: acetate/propionate family kinase [Patescibacteria group bacterium]
MILVINSGSSSLKYRIFDGQLKEQAGGIVERLGLPRSFLEYQQGTKRGRRTYASGLHDHGAALREVFSVLLEEGFDVRQVKSVGHRVVHGGEEFVRPTRVNRLTLERMRKYEQLAPLHNPANLAGIRAAMDLLPDAKQVAVFDTAFHATIPDYAFMYALPRRLYDKFGVRKYGFHGISHGFVVKQVAKKLKKPLDKINLISCHIGSGSSICAVRHGVSIDTSMGLTPLQGVTMSTRCGDIDPSIPLFMVDQLGRSIEEVYDTLNQESGLLGLTGLSDLRDILSILGHEFDGFTPKRQPTKDDKARARLAVDKFCYDIARYIGSYAALLGRVDAVVFTAGIGERNAYIRQRIMSLLQLRPKLKTMVIATNEELEIAEQTRAVR